MANNTRTKLVFAVGFVLGIMVSMLVLPAWRTTPSPRPVARPVSSGMPAAPGYHNTVGAADVGKTTPPSTGLRTSNPDRDGWQASLGTSSTPAPAPVPAPNANSAPEPCPAHCVGEEDSSSSTSGDDDNGGGVASGEADVHPCPEPPQQATAATAVTAGDGSMAYPSWDPNGAPRRWSFAGFDPSTSPLTCDQLESIRKSPVVSSVGAQPRFVEWYYRCVYEPMVIKKTMPVKAIVWRRKKKETAGFGNQLRGEYGAFIMALLTRRLFIIDDQMMDFYFHPPPGIDWRYKELKHLLPKRLKKLTMEKKILDEVPTANLDKWLTKYDVIESLFMWSMDAEFGDNPQGQLMYERVLFASLSGYKRIGLVFEWLLQAPSQPFLTAVERARERIGFGAEPFMAVQFRTFKTGKYFDKFVKDAKDGKVFKCVDHMVDEWAATQAGGRAALPRNVFFTTDRARVFTPDRMRKQWAGYGKVYMNEGSYEPSGKMGARAWRKVSQALVDWYLLGEAVPTIIGGTSYGISAAARVGFRNGLFVIAGKLCEGDYHSPPRLRADPWRDLTI